MADEFIVLRDASRDPAFFNGMIDAKAIFPFVLFLFHMTLSLLAVCVLITVFFAVLSKFGYTLSVLYRKFRASLRGHVVYSYPQWLHSRNKRRFNVR